MLKGKEVQCYLLDKKYFKFGLYGFESPKYNFMVINYEDFYKIKNIEEVDKLIIYYTEFENKLNLKLEGKIK